jgi:tetratricopeptide (TPR) repeat protein
MTKRACTAVALILILSTHAAFGQGPESGEGYFNSGVIHLREGRINLALESFKRAVDADDENPYFRKGLGQAYAARREWKKAIEQFEKALELNPYYVDVRNDLGTALILAGRREQGKEQFLKAYADATNPTPEISARNLGQAYLDEKNYTESINWFRTAIGRNEAYPDPYLGLAEALAATDRLEEAVIILESGVKAAPDDAGLTLALGRAYYQAGRFAEARTRLEQALQMDPSGPIGQAAAAQLQKLPS